MSQNSRKDTFKDKAHYLIRDVEYALTPRDPIFGTKLDSESDVKVKPSHAHAVLSAALGYKSKQALLADVGEGVLDDLDAYRQYWYENIYRGEIDTQTIKNVLSRMGDTPFKQLPERQLMRFIEDALAPECECGVKHPHGAPIFDEHFNPSNPEPVDYVCPTCASDDNCYSTCLFCGDDVLYPAELINRNGECPEHYGESDMDEEEEQDWEDYIEYLNK
ncbi:TPA: hypothetical protein ACVO0R_004810 [Vibrio alginolyticus]|uniref:hypothetical protein n=1 Tax=Vibrio alginolyticus TaxID=663 RepID=UPI003E117F24